MPKINRLKPVLLSMSAFMIALLLASLTGHAADPAGQPLRAAQGLFDLTQPKTLGLKQLSGQHTICLLYTSDAADE